MDCADKSDENTCDYLKFGKIYAEELQPRDQVGSPLIVYMNVSILALPAIDTMNLKFTADFYLNMRWYDLRIDLRDLNENSALNPLNENDLKSLWTPQLSFLNALGPVQTEVDYLVSGKLIRETDSLPEDYSTAMEGGGILLDITVQ